MGNRMKNWWRAADAKQIAVLVFLCAVVLAAVVYVALGSRRDVRETSATQESITVATETAVPKPAPTEDPTEKIATYFQGPKSWKKRRVWSGVWGQEYYDGGSFGGFGCGLCCMANIYCTLTDYKCSPIDMYEFAKRESLYGGGGAIAWGYMKRTLITAGFSCHVGRKGSYSDFQKMMKKSRACIVVVSSHDSTCYWKDTPGHYVTLFLYDAKKDRIFLADSGDPKHNRHWVSLKKIYRSLKMANAWQYLTVTGYNKKKDRWKNNSVTGPCILPDSWK